MKPISRLRGLTPSSFVLLAPRRHVPAEYTCVIRDSLQHQCWLKRAQMLRGRAYLEDGAVDASHLDQDGRLISHWDMDSWHIIAREGDEACATMRFTFHRNAVDPDHLGLASSSVFQTPDAARIHRAVRTYQEKCLDAGDIFGEVGGWAAESLRRGGRKSAAVALSPWPLCRSVGRVRALSTVTSRNHSIGILTRIAAVPLGDEQGQVPSWFDERYGCDMYLSAFTTWDLHDEFEDDARRLAELLYAAPVFVNGSGVWEGNSHD